MYVLQVLLVVHGITYEVLLLVRKIGYTGR